MKDTHLERRLDIATNNLEDIILEREVDEKQSKIDELELIIGKAIEETK